MQLKAQRLIKKLRKTDSTYPQVIAVMTSTNNTNYQCQVRMIEGRNGGM